MANRKKYYALPDGNKVTDDIDEYIAAWRLMAKPIEEHMGLTLTGYDPVFTFTKGNPQSGSTTVSLPAWFVSDLSPKLSSDVSTAKINL